MRRALYLVAFTVFISILPLRLVGAEEEPRVWTMKDAILRAVKVNPLVSYGKYGVLNAEAQMKGARSSFFPRFSTYYQYTYLHPEPWSYMPSVTLTSTVPPITLTSPGGAITVGTRNNYTWALEARQTIFAGGAIMANYEAKKKALDVAHLEEKRVIMDLVLEVKVAYYQVLKAEKMLDLARIAWEQLTSHHRDAESFFSVGLIPKNDLLESEVRLAEGVQNLIRAENNLEEARSRFNSLLKRSMNAPVELEDILNFLPFNASMDVCIQKALIQRPEIKAYEAKIEQAREMVKIARGELLPSVGLIGHYERYGDGPDVRGTTYRSMENWYVAARMDWAIWEGGKTKYELDTRRAQVNQMISLWEAEKDRTALEVKTLFLKVKEAEKQVWVTKKAIEQAEENFRLNREKYREQLATSTQVLDAQSLLTKTKSDYYAAISDYLIYQARLERAMGENNP
ncbi:MAG: TolC family protein [Syntrophales bacterium]|nr:TolC family protein [Syntrophales bacterium]